MKTAYVWCQGALSAIVAWVAAKLGVLFPLLVFLVVFMVIDYITGMLASKTEALEHPDDPDVGWSSKKGTKGILKKVGYLCVITVAVALDYVLAHLAALIGYEVTPSAVFGLLVTSWYLLNELLSIVENSGRMGAPVPPWLAKYIAVLKGKIDQKGETKDE